MKSGTLGMVGIAALIGVTSTAIASTMDLEYDASIGARQNITINYFGSHGTIVGSGKNTLTVGAGQLTYNVLGATGEAANYFSVGQTLTVFCIDIFERAGSGVANFGDPTNAPFPSGNDPLDPHAGSMGSDQASLLSVLYALYAQTAMTGTAQQAAAFQLAIWEIVHEDHADLGASTFAATNLNVNDDGVGVFFASSQSATRALANSWLEQAWDGWHTGSVTGLELAAAFAENFQDVLVIIPIPPSVMLAGLGLIGVLAVRRRVLPS